MNPVLRGFFKGLVILMAGWVFCSCETNRGQIIPYVNVDLYLLVYADLGNMGVGTTKIIENEGVNGIILYRESDLEFFAYDRTCTLWPEHDAAVVEDTSFLGVYVCPECHSTYLLMNGANPGSGPARYPLVEYSVSVNNDLVHIYN